MTLPCVCSADRDFSMQRQVQFQDDTAALEKRERDMRQLEVSCPQHGTG